MKIILSRKGFDSSNGGIASPIFEDGTMVSFPIPSSDSDMYEDLMVGNQTYLSILKDLNYKGKETCHVDPDLSVRNRKSTIEGWRPIFGQINSSASYLLNTVKIEPNDIFLFFGNFHHIERSNGKYNYIHKTKNFYKDNDLQVIWGYLQVGKMVLDAEEQKRYQWHPHSRVIRTKECTNVMFLANDKLSFAKDMPGAGTLKYNVERVLTAPNASKASWIKKDIYDVKSVIGNRKNSSKSKDQIYYAGIWQELGLIESKECEVWAKNIIEM